MTLYSIAELGYASGLDTLRQAIFYAECHWDAWSPGAFEELYAEMEQAAMEDIAGDTLCVHYIGEERCRQMDAELNAYFDTKHDDSAVGFESI